MALITAAIRNAIITNAVANKQFKEREQAIYAERSQLAEDVRIASLESVGLTDAKVEKLVKTAKEIQSTLDSIVGISINRGKSFYIQVNLGGQRRNFYFNGEDWCVSAIFDEPEAVYKIGKDNVSLDRAYGEQLDEINHRHKLLREDHEVLVATLTATIKKFSTVEKLVASWPEAEQLLPAAEVVATGTGVALSVDTLNALCGLPK